MTHAVLGCQCRASVQQLEETSFDSKLSGDVVSRTNAGQLRIKIILCSKIHCLEVLKLGFFSRTNRGQVLGANREHRPENEGESGLIRANKDTLRSNGGVLGSRNKPTVAPRGILGS